MSALQGRGDLQSHAQRSFCFCKIIFISVMFNSFGPLTYLFVLTPCRYVIYYDEPLFSFSL